MKYFAMVHIWNPFLQSFALYKFTIREIIYNANELNKFKATCSNHHIRAHALEPQQIYVPIDEVQLLNTSIIQEPVPAPHNLARF